MSNNKPTAVRWRIFAILALSSFISYTLRYNVSTAGPVMMTDLGLNEIQLGWVFAAFLTGYTVFQLPGGVLGDRWGPRRLLTVIAVLWSFMTVLTAFIPSPAVASTAVILSSLMLVRFLVGAVHAPVYPGTNPAIVNWFPTGGMALPNGLSSAALNLGVAVSAPLLAWSIVEIGWRLSFIVLAPPALLVAVIWWWYGRDKPEEHKAVNRAEIDLIQAGRETDEADPNARTLTWKELLGNSDVRWLTLSYFFSNYTFYVVFSWFFFYLVEVRGFTMINAGFVTSAQWIAGAAGATSAGWFCDSLCRRIGMRWGCRLPLMIAGVASALCMIGGILSPYPTLAVSLMIACFFFNQATEPPYWVTSMSIGGHHSGAVGGAMNTGGNLVGIFNALLVPWIGLTLGWSVAIGSAAVFALIGSAIILLVRPDRQIDDSPA